MTGEVNGGVITAGQVIGLINGISTCVDLIVRMVVDGRVHLARTQRYFN
ncbi:hypothetical protein [Paraherbaspirillum soli]|uniref:Uncharacterized protein n=1 Tax=Paraherbaspirillum soli TaxID=631222 RepID=A0ABW0M3L4_9BURK